MEPKESLNALIPGVKYIRVGPVRYQNGVLDYSYCTTPVVFLSMDDKHQLIFREEKKEKEFVLPKEFFDGKWLAFDRAKEAERTKLNELAGRKVKRISHQNFDSLFIYSQGAPTLQLATKYHVFLKDSYGKDVILDIRYTNSDNWVAI